MAPSPILTLSKEHLKPEILDKDDITTHILAGDLIHPFVLGGLKARFISLPPGTRTIPEAHSHESVFAYIISGSGTFWNHGDTYGMAQNDCTGLRGGTGLAFAFINDAHSEEPLSLLLLSEADSADRIAYFGSAGARLSTWVDPPSKPIGAHDGLPLAKVMNGGAETVSNASKDNSDDFWPSTIFHSLVMSIPNLLSAPETAEIAPLSILASLTSSANCHYTVTQTVVQAHCRAPAYGPRAHSKESRLIFICAASPEGGAKLWLDGEASDLVTGACIRLEAGSGISWCILNEGDEELIFLEFAQDVEDDAVFFPLAKSAGIEQEIQKICVDELAKTWWDQAPARKLGNYPANPRDVGSHA